MSDPQDTPNDVPHPAQGGSYTRDPVTGELTRTHYSRTPEQAAAEADEQATPQPE